MLLLKIEQCKNNGLLLQCKINHRPNLRCEFMCLAEIAITTVLGSVEDERTFSSLKFIKSQLRNHLEGNLDTIVRVFSQGCNNLESFPYANAYKQ
jgi:hypothetical protein